VNARVGVLGAGQAGERHAHGFARHPRARVVGVADVDAGRAEALAERHAARAVRDHDALLALGLDVLVVATPHARHVEPALAAAARGVHVMMEKPIATTLADAHTIVAACAAADVRLAVGFVHRFRAEARQAHHWLATAGRPRLARETINGQLTAAHPAWLADARVAGGGVLLYTAIHGVDRLRWLVGAEVREVTAATCLVERGVDVERGTAAPGDAAARRVGVERGVAALLRFENGCVATLSACAPRFRAEPTLWETEVFTERAMVRLRTRGFAEVSADVRCERFEAADDPDAHDPHYPFARQAADLLRAVETGSTPSVSGVDGLRALEVCLAIYRSGDLGRTVEVEPGAGHEAPATKGAHA
jgi:predicted dehydrogenase